MQKDAGARNSRSIFFALSSEEIDATNAAVDDLRHQEWARPILARFEREGGCSETNMPTMFEVRYARALLNSGINPRYEEQTGVRNTSVDFAFDTNARWLVETYSLAETEAAVAATWNREEFFGRVLSSPRSIGTNETLTKAERKRRLEEQKQSVEGETLQAVERLLSKVSDGKFPLKFPPPSANTYSMLAVDIRSLFRGHADRGDLDQIAYGASAVPERYRCFWPGRDGKLLPIRGIFDPVNTSTKARHFRERVHFLTFVLERTYEREELAQIGYYVANPHLFESHDSAKDAFATFPLNWKARREKAA